jgi:type II secretory pathway component GspD/PulD (secretin)
MFKKAITTATSRLIERGTLQRNILYSIFVGAFALCGACGPENVNQTTAHLGEWKGADRHVVLSGSPARDSAAYNTSEDQLQEADWKVLEAMGPKPIWDRLAELKQLGKKRKASTAPSTSSSLANAVSMRPRTPTTEPARDIPIINLPDGKIRMVYRLRHYGGSSITATVDGGTSRRTLTQKPADLAPLVAVLATNLGDASTVVPLPDENALIITCNQVMKEPVMNLLAKIDMPAQQVEITAKMFEVSHDFDFQYGCQLMLKRLAADGAQSAASNFSTKSFLDAIQSTTTGNVAQDGSVLRLMQVFQGAGVSLDGTFQLMSEAGLINVVASPRMTVAAGQTGYMLAGQELPIQQVAIIANAQSTSTTYKPVGVQLYITPQAMGPDTVKLHAISVVSAVQGFAPLPSLTIDSTNNKQLVNPILESREAETSVTLQDGSTLVFGGLRMIRTTIRESKIPGLGDIPGLGWLFKNHRSQKQLTDLYFFVTPTLL